MQTFRRLSLILTVLAALLAPSVASASVGHTHRCRSGYHQKATLAHHKRHIACVRNRRHGSPATPVSPPTSTPPASPTTTPPTTTTPATPPTTTTPATPPTTSSSSVDKYADSAPVQTAANDITTVTIGGTDADEQEKWNFCADMAYYLDYQYPGQVPYFYFAGAADSAGLPSDTCYFYVNGGGWYYFSEVNLQAYATLTFPIAVPYK
jgi:hypothetical protein